MNLRQQYISVCNSAKNKRFYVENSKIRDFAAGFSAPHIIFTMGAPCSSPDRSMHRVGVYALMLGACPLRNTECKQSLSRELALMRSTRLSASDTASRHNPCLSLRNDAHWAGRSSKRNNRISALLTTDPSVRPRHLYCDIKP